jgi:hypothetical protein
VLRVTNTAPPTKKKTPDLGTLTVDLKALGIDVRNVWFEYTGAVSLDGQSVENRENAEQKRNSTISYNAYAG